jgi:hypothetical protein
MKMYEQIKDMLCDELEGIAKKKELTSSSLDVIYRSVDILKDLATIKAMEQEYPDEGYSKDGYSQGYSQGYFNRMPIYAYDGDMSYARKRDSMGRYSRDGHYDGRSYDYSGDTKEELQRIMSMAQNDRERDAIRKALDSMR